MVRGVERVKCWLGVEVARCMCAHTECGGQVCKCGHALGMERQCSVGTTRCYARDISNVLFGYNPTVGPIRLNQQAK
jgi:hypothetical protein